MLNNVILVDELDNQIGVYPKLEAHKEAKLHRAFSIFIFNSKNELLLQQRAISKYHSGGLWTNTVCSHPRPEKDINDEARLRLTDEMGFTTDVKKIFSFLYKSEYDNGLCEHEFDHVFIGKYEGNIVPNPEEVMDYKWIKISDLLIDIKQNTDNYTSWFKIIIENEDLLKQLEENLV